MPGSTDEGDEVTWASLPNKDQLFVLIAARFAEPVVRTSIQSLDTSKSADDVIREAAILQTVFTLAQCITAPFWGYVADSPRGGRRIVLLISLGGSLVTSVAFGFIRDFRQAVILRVIEGVVNGNTAIIRTMVSEVVKERRFQAKAFILMPLCYNIAVIISPMTAGLLADLAGSYPEIFGENPFLSQFPYAPPAIACGLVTLVAFLLVFFHLKETQPIARHRYDLGLDIAARIASLFTNSARRYNNQHYNLISPDEGDEDFAALVEDHEEDQGIHPYKHSTTSILPLSRIFTRNLCLTVISHAIQEGHIAAYTTLWPSFLSGPVIGKHEVQLPFHFAGGLGMPANQVAISLALVGALGIPLQIFGYPRVVKRLGLLRTWRTFLVGLPLAYFIIPYISVVPSTSPPSAARDGPVVWLMILIAQALIIGSTTFVVPSQIVLTNNSSPHPTALGRTHSITVMLTSLTRTVSPVVGGLVYSYWSIHGVTGMAWWMMSVTSLVGCMLSMYVYEGNGHEIWLEGDEE